MNSPSPTSQPGLSIPAQGSETVNYDLPTPETDAFMTRIDDSTVDLGQVESQLKKLECERDKALINYERLNAQTQKMCGLILDDWTGPYSFKAHLRRHAALLDAAERVRGSNEMQHQPDERMAHGPNAPIRYYACPSCSREFVQPPEGYQGMCQKCQAEALGPHAGEDSHARRAMPRTS